MNESRTLAHFASTLALKDVPRAARDKAIDLLVDQMGIQLICATLPWSKQITRMVEELGGRPDSTVVYYGFKTAPDNAAFLNASYGHGFEMDDIHMRVVNHPGCIAIPAALAMTERHRMSGADLLLGTIIGLELICRVSAVTGPQLLRRGHNTHPPNAPFGVAAASARLLGLSEEGILNAIGIAGSHSAAGLREFNQTGGTLKRMHAGIPAAAGVRSALLAQHGITGPTTILEGKYGFCKVFCNQEELGPMTEGLGSEYIFMETTFKEYCAVSFIHAPVEATQNIIDEHKPELDKIAKIVVGTSEEAILHAGTIIEPRDIVSAQFSTRFSVALRLVTGGNGIKEYVPGNLQNPAILELAHKVEMAFDEQAEKDYPARYGAVVRIFMKSGACYESRVRSLRGGLDRPLTHGQIRDKYRRLVDGILSEANAKRLARAHRTDRGSRRCLEHRQPAGGALASGAASPWHGSAKFATGRRAAGHRAGAGPDRRRRRLCAGIGASLVAGVAFGEASPVYPNRLVHMLVGFPPGGGTDMVARLFASKLGESFGQTIVVDNRPGAGGNIAAQITAKAAPDGYNLLMVASTHAIDPSLHKDPPYDAVNDFAAVTQLIKSQYVLVVSPTLPVASVQDLIALAKKKPGKLNFASTGIGSSPHLAGELFRIMTNTEIAHIPFKGTGPSIEAVLSGQVEITFANISSAIPLMQSGGLKGLAVSGASRSSALPALPTVAEAGVPGFDVTGWNGIVTPKGTPKAILQKIHADSVRVLRTADVTAQLTHEGMDVVGSSPDEFQRFLQAEQTKWAKVIKDAGIRTE